MPLPPQFLDDLRTRLPMSAVVGRRLRLVRAGREHKACCPFHKEKTPSFTVSDDKGFFHCFGCGAHGDIIGFVMRHDNLSFTEAVEHLAAQVGMTIPQATPEEHARAERQKGLYELVEAACRFFEAQLRSPCGGRARDYLAGRGLDEQTIARFRLGFAPADGQSLIRTLAAEGFAEEAMIEAGLARRPEGGGAVYSFFRNRAIFPVSDRRGRVVAFGARLLEGDGPKYINSPDTPLFDKGRTLYNLGPARVAAGQGQTVIVAEGYTDVIALVRAGFEAAVAPLGTALSEVQIEVLWQLAPVPVLCFDGDEAGRRAAWRVVDRALPLLRPDHSVLVAFMPSGEDPDSLIRLRGAAAMRTVLTAARPLADVLWDRATARRQIDTPEGRAGLKAALAAEAQDIADRTVRDYYLRDFRHRLEAAFPWRPGGDKKGRMAIAVASGPRPTRRAGLSQTETAEAVLLAFLINHPALFEEFGESLGLIAFSDVALDSLKQAAIDILALRPGLDSSELKSYLTQSGHLGVLDRLLSERIYAEWQYAREGASLEQARESWIEVWGRLEHRRLRDDLDVALADYARDQTAGNWARVRALRLQAERHGRSGDDSGLV